MAAMSRVSSELGPSRRTRRPVRYAYEWHDDSGNWVRSYDNENWEFDDNGLMRRRYASIHDLPIKASERKYRWPLGRRPPMSIRVGAILACEFEGHCG
jgi:nuclear transport factor 2 (NTF2) superfamily protein